MKKRNLFLFILGILLISFLVFTLVTDFNMFSLATDSGFDTSYDGGGSSGDGSIIDLIILAIHYPIPTLIIIVIMVLISISEKNKRRTYDNNLNYQFIENKYSHTQNKEILKQTYQIFYDVQIAWMNFDYNKLRTLVNDELYNMYYNELETLKLKGQRNIMEGFRINNISLVSTKEENSVIEYCVNLKVSFFDYIIDTNGNVVRGSKGNYHSMTYLLTFASSAIKLDTCPNCSAPLPDNSICDYCGSQVQGLREMRLVKKVNIKQERVN